MICSHVIWDFTCDIGAYEIKVISWRAGRWSLYEPFMAGEVIRPTGYLGQLIIYLPPFFCFVRGIMQQPPSLASSPLDIGD